MKKVITLLPTSAMTPTFAANVNNEKVAILRNRRLNTDQNVVIWQIGCVGDLGFNFSGYDNRNLKILVEYKFY